MQKDNVYSLIPYEDFKALLGIDSREDKNARFCLVTATLTIEQFCKRKLLRKKYFERLDFNGDLFLPLREYPVSKVLAAYLINSEQVAGNREEILEPEFFSVVPDCGTDMDFPFAVSLSPALRRYRGLAAIKVVYWAGYQTGKVPADLASACLELAGWNLNRYRGKQFGIIGKKGEGFELSMPENVRQLLEPYKRKLI